MTRSSTRPPRAVALTSGGAAADEKCRALPIRFAMTRSMIAGSAMTSGRPAGMSARAVRARGPSSSREPTTISPRDLSQTGDPGEHRQRPGLQPAHVQQALGETGELVEGLLGGSQQFLTLGRGEESVA